MKFSYGFVETRGYIAAIEAADAMVKAAKVDIVKLRKAGGALVMVIVKGELSACRAAVDAGSAAADRVGELVSSNVIPNPFDDTDMLIEQYLGGRKKKQQAAKNKPVKKKGKVSPGRSPANASVKKPVVKTPKVNKPKNSAFQLKAKKKNASGLTSSVKSKTVSVKKAGPKTDVSFSQQERLIHLIAAAPKGITVDQLAGKFKKPVAEVRQLIKKLMDRNLIEKVQKRYFMISSRPNK